MNKTILLTLTLLLTTFALQAQVLKGVVKDASDGSPLPFVNIQIVNTDEGTTSDIDGNYEVESAAGSHISVEFSYVGYQSQTVEVDLTGEKVIDINLTPGNMLQATELTVASPNQEKATALLLEQKRAVEIKEGIGAIELSQKGVGDAQGAIAKISGVNKSEGTGDVFIRGLGDRYLTTTLNGLPLPSNKVERKNIELNLFPSDVIQSVGISKTYNPSFYQDFGSGNVDIASKEHFGDTKINLSMTQGVNTNMFKYGVFGSLKRTSNFNYLGFYDTSKPNLYQFLARSWNTEEQVLPMNFSIGLNAGTSFDLFKRKAKIFVTLNQSNKFEYRKGLFDRFRENSLRRHYSDFNQSIASMNTNAMLNFNYKLAPGHDIRITSLFINDATDELTEGGRNKEGFVYDNQPKDLQVFLRDQRFTESRMVVNQIGGEHKIGENWKLDWAGAVNLLNSYEPNRIRNTLSLYDDYAQFNINTTYQTRRSYQTIYDYDYNGFLKLNYDFGKEKQNKLLIGFDARRKNRTFNSQFIGIAGLGGIHIDDIDNLDEILNVYNYRTDLTVNKRRSDVYAAEQNVYAPFLNLSFTLAENYTFSVGGRYEWNKQHVAWDVNNYQDPVTNLPRLGRITNTYNNFLPNLSIRAEVAENHVLRLAGSRTNSVPEFRELSPFEYVDPNANIKSGNPNLKSSTIDNVDLKYEFYPKSGQLISLTGFTKIIQDPINIVQNIEASGRFEPRNTGNKANVYGLEFETRLDILEREKSKLSTTLNLSKMWTKQDLYGAEDAANDPAGIIKNNQYNGNTTAKLQGAADFIVNGSLTYTYGEEKPWITSLVANYSSDRIYALGSPTATEGFYNDDIIEKGFVTLDFISEKKFGEHIGLKLSIKNLLNPARQYTQDGNRVYVPLDSDGDGRSDTATSISGNRVTESYKRGVEMSLGFGYSF